MREIKVGEYIVGEIALLEKYFPIKQFENPDGGYFTPAETEATGANRYVRSVDGTEVIIGLNLVYEEYEKDALEIALGDNLSYTFIGHDGFQKLMKLPEWPGYTHGEN